MTHRHRVEVRQEDADDEKLATSQYLLTLNSNRVVVSMQDPYVAKFRRQVNQILENLPEYIVPNPGYEPDTEMIVTATPFLEIGGKQHRLHCHAHVVIKHNSNIRLDCGAISAELHGAYCNARHIKGSNELQKVLRYLRKQA